MWKFMALQKEEAIHRPEAILTEQEQTKPNLTKWPDTLAVKEKMSARARAYMQEGAAPEYLGKLGLSWYGAFQLPSRWALGKPFMQGTWEVTL